MPQGLCTNKLVVVVLNGISFTLPRLILEGKSHWYCNDVIMSPNASQVTSLTIVYSAFYSRSKKTSKIRVTGLCVVNSPVTSEFPAQKANNSENFSIWWRHHGIPVSQCETIDYGSTRHRYMHWLCKQSFDHSFIVISARYFIGFHASWVIKAESKHPLLFLSLELNNWSKHLTNNGFYVHTQR